MNLMLIIGMENKAINWIGKHALVGWVESPIKTMLIITNYLNYKQELL